MSTTDELAAWVTQAEAEARSQDPATAIKGRATLGLVVPFRAWFLREHKALTAAHVHAFNEALGVALAGFADALPPREGWTDERLIDFHLGAIREHALRTLNDWRSDERDELHGPTNQGGAVSD